MIAEENLKQMYIDAVKLRNSINSTITALGFDITNLEYQALYNNFRIVSEFITHLEITQETNGGKPFLESLLFDPEIK